MRRAFLYAIPLLLGAFSVLSRTESPDAAERIVQSVPAAEEPESDENVTDEQLKTYIDVYSAMQLDHSLTVEEAIKPHNVTLQDFRNIERHVQNKSRLVAKVRAALLEQATQRSAFSEPHGTSASVPPPPAKKK